MRKFSSQVIVLTLVAGLGAAAAGCSQVRMIQSRMALKDGHTAYQQQNYRGAVEAYEKAIAADPNKAESYYQKGVNLINKATTDKTGKVIPAPGTAEALNKYLELQPTGQFADGAKGMLQYIGSSIETSYGSRKKAATKK